MTTGLDPKILAAMDAALRIHARPGDAVTLADLPALGEPTFAEEAARVAQQILRAEEVTRVAQEIRDEALSLRLSTITTEDLHELVARLVEIGALRRIGSLDGVPFYVVAKEGDDA